ncbi:MAG TPA: NADH-quinone oxidoreductase subunit NuoF [Gemmatimonadota bacterium]|nr:NADH-quinone oxidoreductase subunit NuoF [Gemmatimonadota bacterium]
MAAPRILMQRALDRPGESHTLPAYEAAGGYRAVRKALGMDPVKITDEVKASGLRGRGGAGFPTGTKWSFTPRESEKPKYLVCNSDESEPGTFKDRWLLENDPHVVIEGMMIAAIAIDCHLAFNYFRGEFAYPEARWRAALDEAYGAGYLGKGIFGSDYDLEIVTHSGAGAYIAGEETGLLESLEGKKAMPRNKPPFPAVEGLFRSPTVINNTETLAVVPWIIENGAAAYVQYGTEKSRGTKLWSCSGPINRPGVYEVELGVEMMGFLEEQCGGLMEGVGLKGVIPGGSSVPVMTPDECRGARMDYEGLRERGSLVGSGGFIVIGDNVSAVDCLLNLAHFYAHESCGQCTPCREGCGWIEQLVGRVRDGRGSQADLERILRLSDAMAGKTICALADALAWPSVAFIKKYPQDFAALCPDPVDLESLAAVVGEHDHILPKAS